MLAVDRHERVLGSEPGKTDGYHRLHRGGDRQSDSALWTIVLSGMATHPETRAYVERRTKATPVARRSHRHQVREPVTPLPLKHERVIAVTIGACGRERDHPRSQGASPTCRPISKGYSRSLLRWAK